MGTHTTIFLKEENKSLYFKYCYPNDIFRLKQGDFKKNLEEFYFEKNQETPEYKEGNALFNSSFPYDFYFEYNEGKVFELIETNLFNRFVKIEIDSSYNNEIARELSKYFRENPVKIYKGLSEGFIVEYEDKYIRFDKDLYLTTENHNLTTKQIMEFMELIKFCKEKIVFKEYKLSELKLNE
jgi:hypothetical protein